MKIIVSITLEIVDSREIGLSFLSSVGSSFLKQKCVQYPAIHTNYTYIPLYNVIIVVDAVLRQKRNFKHEKQLSQQYRHIATLACMIKAFPPPG